MIGGESAVILALVSDGVQSALARMEAPGRVITLEDIQEVRTYLAAKQVDLLLLPFDRRQEAADLRDLQRTRSPQGQVLVVDPSGAGLDLGALDPWRGQDAPPPPPEAEITEIVDTLLEYARVGNLTGLVGGSEGIASVLRTLVRVAASEVPVLIQGPSGTGKELVARGIHRSSLRAEEPFIAVNTPGLSETLIESELFGHEKGAFTGATSQKEGVFEAASGGTIFLDEIGDLSRGLQSKLLRVLEQQEFLRVGGTRPVRVRARVLAATNVDLERAVAEGRFREDLYFRLKVVTIDIPPLRDRPEDVLPLLNHFVRDVCRRRKSDFAGFMDDALQQLIQYPWPGNVRELRNLVEHVVLLHPDQRITAPRLARIFAERSRSPNLPTTTGRTPEQAEREMIFKSLQALHEQVDDLREAVLGRTHAAPAGQADGPLGGEIRVPLGVPMKEIEFLLIQETLQRLDGDKRKTAEVLGIGLRTLYRRLEKRDALDEEEREP